MTTSIEAQIDPMTTPNQGIRFVPMTESDYWNYSSTGKVYKSDIELRGMDNYQRHTCNFTLTFCDSDHEARRVFQGPAVKGEYTYLIPQATVISDPPQAFQERLNVKQGDLLIVCGNLYEYFAGTHSKGAHLAKVEI